MTILGPSTDYTDLDFDALRARLFSLIASVFPDWSDTSVTNFGNLLVELFSHTGDVLTFLMDNHARESRIATASQRRSLISLVKLIRYTASGASAATVSETFTLSAAMAGDVTFPAGTRVSTLAISTPTKFQLLEDLVLLAGETVGEAIVEHSESRTDRFQSTGLGNQEVQLSATPYIDDSAEVSASNGAFTQVDSLLSSTSADRHFTVSVDQNDRATVRFGNGVNGVSPAGTITVDYKTGGGSAGNVEPNSLRKLEGSFVDSLGNTVQVTVTNPLLASGGSPRESTEEIRQNAPESLRALTRSVAREDFEIHAQSVAGVARAFMTTSNEDVGVAENTGILYIVPTGGGVPTEALRDAVLEAVTTTYPSTLTFQKTVANPIYLIVDVTTRVHFRKGVNKTTAAAAVRTALADLFAISSADGTPNELINFGYFYQDSDGVPTGELPFSDIYNAIRDVTSVRKVDDTEGLLLNGESEDITIATREFPVLGTVIIIDAETGVAVP